jgi:heme/copper-type cytochrome/quinol oxidase subunit 2
MDDCGVDVECSFPIATLEPIVGVPVSPPADELADTGVDWLLIVSIAIVLFILGVSLVLVASHRHIPNHTEHVFSDPKPSDSGSSDGR